MRASVLRKFLPLLATVLLASACSTKNNEDPIEPFNRGVFKFNQVTDQYIIRPVAKGYRYITPQVVRTHIGNVADNLYEPLNMINGFLQGNFTQGMNSFWRFVINSTVGIGGLNDVASTAGIKPHSEDFGQTLAVWGVGPGPYVVLPILGPSNARDTVGTVSDWFMNPVNYVGDQPSTGLWIALGEGLVKRERLLDPIDDINSSSLDPYATYRSIYKQRREAEIKNRKTDAPKLNY